MNGIDRRKWMGKKLAKMGERKKEIEKEIDLWERKKNKKGKALPFLLLQRLKYHFNGHITNVDPDWPCFRNKVYPTLHYETAFEFSHKNNSYNLTPNLITSRGERKKVLWKNRMNFFRLSQQFFIYEYDRWSDQFPLSQHICAFPSFLVHLKRPFFTSTNINKSIFLPTVPIWDGSTSTSCCCSCRFKGLFRYEYEINTVQMWG